MSNAMYRPVGSTQSIDFNSSPAVQSTAVDDSCYAIAVTPDNPCYVKVGANPTASTTSGCYLWKESTYFFAIKPGEKVSIIGDSSGKIKISELMIQE